MGTDYALGSIENYTIGGANLWFAARSGSWFSSYQTLGNVEELKVRMRTIHPQRYSAEEGRVLEDWSRITIKELQLEFLLDELAKPVVDLWVGNMANPFSQEVRGLITADFVAGAGNEMRWQHIECRIVPDADMRWNSTDWSSLAFRAIMLSPSFAISSSPQGSVSHFGAIAPGEHVPFSDPVVPPSP